MLYTQLYPQILWIKRWCGQIVWLIKEEMEVCFLQKNQTKLARMCVITQQGNPYQPG